MQHTHCSIPSLALLVLVSIGIASAQQADQPPKKSRIQAELESVTKEMESIGKHLQELQAILRMRRRMEKENFLKLIGGEEVLEAIETWTDKVIDLSARVQLVTMLTEVTEIPTEQPDSLISKTLGAYAGLISELTGRTPRELAEQQLARCKTALAELEKQKPPIPELPPPPQPVDPPKPN